MVRFISMNIEFLIFLPNRTHLTATALQKVARRRVETYRHTNDYGFG